MALIMLRVLGLNFCMSSSEAATWDGEVVVNSLRSTILACTIKLSEIHFLRTGVRGGAVVEALRYKPEGRGIDSRWCNWNFSLT
jgi:hypothetical protein